MSILIKKWWDKWEQTILTIASIIIVGSGSYLFGVVTGLEKDREQIMITEGGAVNTTLCSAECAALGIEEDASHDGVSKQGYTEGEVSQNSDTCRFLGSKNGSKYYPPDCTALRRIKKENLICFASEDDAKHRGYGKTKACS